MEKFIEDGLDELRKAIADDPRVKKLDALEKRLNESPEVFLLAKKKEAAESQYSLSLSLYNKGSKELEAAEHSLYEAKLALDSVPLSKEYTEAFIAVSSFYRQIDDIIFSPFRKKILTGDEQ